MAERVRRFRVKNAFPVCNVDVGDIGEYGGKSDAGLMLFSNPKWRSGRPDGCVAMYHYDVEELPAFKVGDAVRVKADAPRAAEAGKCAAYGHSFGNKLTILRVRDGGLQGHWVFSNSTGTDYCHEDHLEPWNDAEEWNGTAWVAKKPEPKFKKGDRVKIVGLSIADVGKEIIGKTATIIRRCANYPDAWDIDVDGTHRTFPESSLMLVSEWTVKPEPTPPKPAIVCLREDGKIRTGTITPFDSTNEAFRKAEEWAALYPGKEYVVLQEKGSKRVEKKSNADRFESQFISDIKTGDSFNLLDANDVVVATGKTIGVSRQGNCIIVTYDATGD